MYLVPHVAGIYSRSPKRVFLSSQSDQKNAAELVVIRDRSMSGGLCSYAIYVDDQLAARIYKAERAVFRLEPGERRLKVTRDPQETGLCASGDDMTEEKVTLSSSEQRYFRLSTNIAGSPNLQVIQPPKEKL